MEIIGKFGSNPAQTRREDHRFLTGQGAYVSDLVPKMALHVRFLRSDVAHGRILSLNVSTARAMPGVLAVYTAQDIVDAGYENHLEGAILVNRQGEKGADPRRPLLAEDFVRFHGEAVAAVVAETPVQAQAAVAHIQLEVEVLPAKLDVALGNAGDAPIHPEAPDNLAYTWDIGDEARVDAALLHSEHRVTLTVDDNRVIAASMETRGLFWEPLANGRLHLCISGQGVHGTKAKLSKWLKRSPDDLRVTNPDVGGGFGMKAMQYPETFVCALAAQKLQKPVAWISSRREAMLCDNAGRDLICTAELGFDAEHRLTAYKMTSVSNLGAYNSGYGQPIQSELFSKVLTGTYDLACVYMKNQGVYTNTAQVDAYRGAGRPEAIYVLERAMDYAAREIGVDPFALRLKNFIKPDQFPYQTLVGETYDVGDFPKVLIRSLEEADIAGFEARRLEALSRGQLLGVGLCYYIEAILGSPAESACLEIGDDGIARLYVGTQSNGQGHETVYAQFVQEALGLQNDQIEIIQGDSDQIKKGGGTGGSRSVTVQGTAIAEAGQKLLTNLLEVVAGKWNLSKDAVLFEEGTFREVRGNRYLTLTDAAQLCRDIGKPELTQANASITLQARSFPNGAHIAEIEIDPETGKSELTRYTVVDDFGVIMNPMLVQGQVHGGVVQGIGQALSEHVLFAPDGRLVSDSLQDYGLPRALDMPQISFHSEPTPSTANALGMKGCGEAGTVGAMAATANAVMDALYRYGVRKLDMPLTPPRLWQAMQNANITVPQKEGAA